MCKQDHRHSDRLQTVLRTSPDAGSTSLWTLLALGLPVGPWYGTVLS
jgi:hypothetical protein